MLILRENEPDAEDCERHTKISVAVGGRILSGTACWYPQMGGYIGKAIAVPSGELARCAHHLLNGTSGTKIDLYFTGTPT